MSPFFSIITVVYNGENLIEGTMQSVLNQTFTDYEYLVIDGLSKDNTLEVVESVKKRFPTEGGKIHFFSERDKGLYDAMNKGLRLAKGRFVLFLNGGDRLFSTTTLAQLAAAATPSTDILYGETMLVDDNRTHIGTRSELTVQVLPKKLTWRSMRLGMVVCHQSFLPSRHLTPPYMEGNLAADIDWVIDCLKKAQNPTNANIILSEYLMGGVSKSRHQQSLRDRYAVLDKHFGKIGNFFNHILITMRAILFKIKNLGKPTY
jgi:glycosyltransferase involved in cell wall biosynthesis